jgi:hypothetical protein
MSTGQRHRNRMALRRLRCTTWISQAPLGVYTAEYSSGDFMLDKLEDRLEKQKNTVASRQVAYVEAMKARVAREEAERLANRIPRAEAHFTEIKTAIAVQIARFARARKGRPGIESIKPFEVAREFDGFKGANLDVRNPQDPAHEIYQAFIAWGAENRLELTMVQTENGAHGIRVSVAQG